MTHLEDVVTPDTPHLRVTFNRGDDGKQENFSQAVHGKIPLLSLIGQLCSVQERLLAGIRGDIDQPCLVVTWDASELKFRWWCAAGIPLKPLVGYIEVMKSMLTGSMLAQMAQAAQRASRDGIVGPDGQLFRG